MSQLKQRALAHVPLTYETVLSFYDGTRSGTAEQCLKALCESHERLRAELQGAEVLIEQDRNRIAAALALAERYGGIDGAHHKQWVIDQMLRAMLAHKYESWRERNDKEALAADCFEWDEGVAP